MASWLKQPSLLWHHNGCDGVSNHQPHECLLNRSFMGRSKETSKLRATALCVGNSPETGEFPAQMASNAESVSVWWHHHDPNGVICGRIFGLSSRNKHDNVCEKPITWSYMYLSDFNKAFDCITIPVRPGCTSQLATDNKVSVLQGQG